MTAGVDGRLRWVSHGRQATYGAGEALGRACRGGEIILLEGPLGAGKTVLAQGVAVGLGVVDTVTSPTFTILKEYSGRLPLAHFDFYRVDPERAVDLEFGDYLGQDGVCVVEWASRVPQVVPSDYLLLELRYGPDSRRPDARDLAAYAVGRVHTTLLEAVRTQVGRSIGRASDQAEEPPG